MPSKRYNHIHQISDKNILSAITANRAFRGMAGLAVLYPSVVDYIGQAIKDSPVCLLGDFRGYSDKTMSGCLGLKSVKP